MNLFAEFERDFDRLLRGVCDDYASFLQAASDDLNAIEARLQRMIADAPPYDGHDRRGK